MPTSSQALTLLKQVTHLTQMGQLDSYQEAYPYGFQNGQEDDTPEHVLEHPFGYRHTGYQMGQEIACPATPNNRNESLSCPSLPPIVVPVVKPPPIFRDFGQLALRRSLVNQILREESSRSALGDQTAPLPQEELHHQMGKVKHVKISSPARASQRELEDKRGLSHVSVIWANGRRKRVGNAKPRSVPVRFAPRPPGLSEDESEIDEDPEPDLDLMSYEAIRLPEASQSVSSAASETGEGNAYVEAVKGSEELASYSCGQAEINGVQAKEDNAQLMSALMKRKLSSTLNLDPSILGNGTDSHEPEQVNNDSCMGVQSYDHQTGRYNWTLLPHTSVRKSQAFPPKCTMINSLAGDEMSRRPPQSPRRNRSAKKMSILDLSLKRGNSLGAAPVSSYYIDGAYLLKGSTDNRRKSLSPNGRLGRVKAGTNKKDSVGIHEGSSSVTKLPRLPSAGSEGGLAPTSDSIEVNAAGEDMTSPEDRKLEQSRVSKRLDKLTCSGVIDCGNYYLAASETDNESSQISRPESRVDDELAPAPTPCFDLFTPPPPVPKFISPRKRTKNLRKILTNLLAKQKKMTEPKRRRPEIMATKKSNLTRVNSAKSPLSVKSSAVAVPKEERLLLSRRESRQEQIDSETPGLSQSEDHGDNDATEEEDDVNRYRESSLMKNVDIKVMRMRTALPPARPNRLCFRTRISGCSHAEVKHEIEARKNGKVLWMQYDPIHLQGYEDISEAPQQHRCMWIFEMSPDTDIGRLLFEGFKLRGFWMNVRLVDDVYEEEYRAYSLCNQIFMEHRSKKLGKKQLRKRFVKASRYVK